MTTFERPGGERIPAGHYSFRLNREVEVKLFDGKDKNGNPAKHRKYIFYMIGINEAGEFSHIEGLVAWDPRYAQLLAALGIEHSKDVEVSGSIFEADIEYEADPKNPIKSYPHLKNILGKATDDDGIDIPF